MRGNLLKKTISIPEDVWNQIIDYQFQKRIQSASRAVEKLILDGLKHIEDQNVQLVWLILLNNWYPATDAVFC